MRASNTNPGKRPREAYLSKNGATPNVNGAPSRYKPVQRGVVQPLTLSQVTGGGRRPTNGAGGPRSGPSAAPQRRPYVPRQPYGRQGSAVGPRGATYGRHARPRPPFPAPTYGRPVYGTSAARGPVVAAHTRAGGSVPRPYRPNTSASSRTGGGGSGSGGGSGMGGSAAKAGGRSAVYNNDALPASQLALPHHGAPLSVGAQAGAAVGAATSGTSSVGTSATVSAPVAAAMPPPPPAAANSYKPNVTPGRSSYVPAAQSRSLVRIHQLEDELATQRQATATVRSRHVLCVLVRG